jgi:diguanylate cyclase (GGDEF)-like protein
MAGFSITAVGLTLLIAASQFLLGVAVGWWFKDRRVAGFLLSEGRARSFLSRLHDITTTTADELAKHTTRLEEISHELVHPHSATRRAQAEAVILDAISQTVMANKRLHSRISSAEQQLQDQARKIDFELAATRIDSLTQLPNRRAFDDELRSRLDRRAIENKPLSLLFVDLDDFKRINNEYGNDAGDRLLRHTGDILTATMRDRDLVVRYSGEEFAVIVADTALPEAIRAAERALKALRESTCHFEGKELKITASIGVAEALPREESQTLCRRTDAALSSAMESGRDTAFFHDGKACHPVMHDRQDNNDQLDTATRRREVYGRYVAALGVDARTDVLTGLPNRRSFSDELRRRVTEAKKTNKPLSLMLVGVDNLGTISAFKGQDSVDDVLRKVAQVVSASVRDTDMVTRFGWEEFAVILPETKYEDARKAHLRAQNALAACMHELHDVTISSGLAELADEDDSVTLAKRAETALSKAKQAGGNRTELLKAGEPEVVG